MKPITFTDEHGSFTMKQPENTSYLYFPLASETGLKSSVTPNLGGDTKTDQETFLLEPVSSENLHNNRSTRNFFFVTYDAEVYSATGVSARQEDARFSPLQDDSELSAGFMWHTLKRASKTSPKVETIVTSFIPRDDNVEIMHVTVRNLADRELSLTPYAAIPIYGRSADNIRDHRHVTSLLHRITVTEQGVEVRPKLSFDERGHQKNDITYFVYGITGKGEMPERFFPVVEDFIGEGGSLIAPLSVKNNLDGVEAGTRIDGKEAHGGFKFRSAELGPGERASYTILIGAGTDTEGMRGVVSAFDNEEKVNASLEKTRRCWQDKVNVSFLTGSRETDSYLRWTCFQPMLRRLYGCSFLPHHDYGKGGRGWRDLWQDCLSLLFMNPDGVRQMIVDNYAGVRMDGTNATIIGEKQGEFRADRNSITRVWMDHGFWPFLTTKLYIDQTGDMEILSEKVPYFKDRQVKRGLAVDSEWRGDCGTQQKTGDQEVYRGSIAEHILLQQLCAFYEVGGHNHMRLRNADWNDALDMAPDRGESVAFTSAYVFNFKELADCLEEYERITKRKELELAEEMTILLTGDTSRYEDIEWKRSVLDRFTDRCTHDISGRTVQVPVTGLVRDLREKAEWLAENIRRKEWVTDREGNGWFNGYYDNNGNQVEGMHGDNVRMILTSQVFAIMSGTADREMTGKICRSADRYLYREKAGGYRINTRFDEDKFDLGRMFGFAYGEKENGAVFSHMTVMYANALYRRGFISEGYRALSTLLAAAMDFETSKIYPGIPEYFDADGRGMYHYLTGAASWFMLTMITEVYGVRGVLGSMTLAPKLLPEQFDAEGNAGIKLNFLNRTFLIRYHNPRKISPEMYGIVKAECGSLELRIREGKAYLDREIIETLEDTVHVIDVTLDKLPES